PRPRPPLPPTSPSLLPPSPLPPPPPLPPSPPPLPPAPPLPGPPPLPAAAGPVTATMTEPALSTPPASPRGVSSVQSTLPLLASMQKNVFSVDRPNSKPSLSTGVLYW